MTDGYLHSVYDTVGPLGRSIETITRAMSSLEGETPPSTLKKPTALLYPDDYFPFPEPHAQRALDAFVSQLETHFDLKRKTINLNDLWLKQNPSGTGLSLDVYLNTAPIHPRCMYACLVGCFFSCLGIFCKTVSDILTFDSYHAHAGVVKEYSEKHGRDPFISPLVRWT